MASSFDRWEKDSFFSAAEEVQESADRYSFFSYGYEYVIGRFVLVNLFY